MRTPLPSSASHGVTYNLRGTSERARSCRGLLPSKAKLNIIYLKSKCTRSFRFFKSDAPSTVKDGDRVREALQWDETVAKVNSRLQRVSIDAPRPSKTKQEWHHPRGTTLAIGLTTISRDDWIRTSDLTPPRRAL